MSKIDQLTLGLYHNRLMREKLGPHLNWKAPEIRNIVGPFDPSAFQHYEEKRLILIAQCQKKLAEYSDDQIVVLIDQNQDDPDELVNEWTGFLRNEIYKLEKQRPAWFAGGLGHTDYQADFNYWGGPVAV